MSMNHYLRKALALCTALCLVVSGLTIAPMEAAAQDTEAAAIQTVIYVGGNNAGASDENSGESAATALKTIKAAYDKIPADNVRTTIVICGEVDLTDSGLDKYGENTEKMRQRTQTGVFFPNTVVKS